ncbi:MAG: N-succinylarginine dihydrolase [Myxococcota bacterium]
MRELNLDGLVGPTHNYGGLSPGNVASTRHGGQASNPRRAALRGLEKMRLVHGLGVGQAVLPPHERPRLSVLRNLGFTGSDEEIITRAARDHEHLLRLCSSAAAMWTANAATVAPSEDTADGKLHLTPANLQQMFHRALEADETERILRHIFNDPRHFTVHAPLPACSQLADEGAANHTRLKTRAHPAVHLLAWGRRAWGPHQGPTRHPARQTQEASEALARLHQLHPSRTLFPQQHPGGIDAGAFHTDVLAVGNENLLMMHELAFVDGEALVARLRELLGEELRVVVARQAELPAEDAVLAYPFNSQVLTLPDGSMTIIAPVESQENPRARAFLESVLAGDNPVRSIHHLDLKDSMQNGGGPACLRLRVPMTTEQEAALGANVLFTPALHAELTSWVERHYRDRLTADDLRDPKLARESMSALDELTGILKLGSVYDFQRG